MIEKLISKSIRLAYMGGVAVSLGLVSQSAFAQEATQRVEITGSSIKRIQAEGSLPVQTLSKAQIEQSGATNVADLIASLPSLQGFISASASVNGGGGGLQTASIHGIGEDYTLVLINGRRVGPTGTGSVVNLASIPLAAVERVEILTDGASALYGSDAIAGVVNFILKKNQQDFQVEATYGAPEKTPGKGRTTNFAISKGFGDLQKDKYNVLFSYSHDEQTELNASNRSFSRNGGLRPFVNNGRLVTLYQTSFNSTPANAILDLANGDSVAFNPYYESNGNCPAPNTINVNGICRYNFARSVELVPELKRDSFTASANYQFNPNTKFFVEGLYSVFKNTARYAPNAQPLGLDINSTLYKNSIVPVLGKIGVDPTEVIGASYNLRVTETGGRTDEYKTNAFHFATGIEGTIKDWDYVVSYIHSESKQTDTPKGGYLSGNYYDQQVAAGLFNPFAAPSAAGVQALAGGIAQDKFNSSKSTLDIVSARANSEIFAAPGGGAQLGVGADFTKQGYKHYASPETLAQSSVNPTVADTIIGGPAGDFPGDASRNSYGGFAELFVPVLKNFDVTLSGRYDKYERIENDQTYDQNSVFVGSQKQGNSQSSGTYKFAVAYRPVEQLLLRGSYGTGFRAPTLNNVVAPLQNGGSTGFHACPITSGPLLPLCRPGSSEYNFLVGGNALSGDTGLKAEKSKQFTLGFRVEPIKELSLGFDFWDVKLRNQIATLPENTVFDDPVTYASLFTSYFDPIQRQNVLAAILTPFNLAKSEFQGIDWDHTLTLPTSIGKFSFN